jgi:acyl dehydratase
MNELTELQAQIGIESTPSDWFTIEQAMIDAFAACTLDDQWIHLDQARAERESIYGTTIAHGFLVLSLIPYLRRGVDTLPTTVSQVINYGMDSLRFLHPVRSGDRVRLRSTLISVEQRGERNLLLKSRTTIEIEGQAKLALVADSLALVVVGGS